MDRPLQNLRGIAATSLLAVAIGVAAHDAQAVSVDVELQLLVDVSGSVDSSEFALQRDGYADAFRDQDIIDFILDDDDGARFGQSAAQFIYWSGASQQDVAVGWTLLDSEASILAFADAIEATTRPFGGLTAPGSAINFATPEFDGNGFEDGDLVIDVSGDGVENDGADTSDARDAALAAGVTRINGLPIGGDAAVEAFYASDIIGGTGAFSLAASSFDDFEDVVTRKVEFEVTGDTPVIPVPASIPLLLSGVGMLGALRMRRKSA